MLFSVFTFAQEAKISEQIKQNSNGSFNALVMELPGNIEAVKSVQKEWGSFVKKYKGKTKYNKKTAEYFTDDARIKEMSENTVDITAKVMPKDPETLELVVWYNLGVNYLSTKDYAQGMPAAQTMLIDFSKIVYVNLNKEILAEEEKLLSAMNANLKSTQKEANAFDKKIKSYENEIEKIEKKIATEKEAVAANTQKQAKEKAEISQQEKKIDSLKKEIDSLKRNRR